MNLRYLSHFKITTLSYHLQAIRLLHLVDTLPLQLYSAAPPHYGVYVVNLRRHNCSLTDTPVN